MTPAEFVARHEDEWQRIGRILDARNAADAAEFPALYRRLCQHLALAQERRYPPELVDRLNTLALAGQQFLYRPRRQARRVLREFLLADFPRLVRARAALAGFTLLLFYVPLLAGLAATLVSPELLYTLLPAAHVANLESMYDPAARVIGYPRSEGDNLAMFGYYVWNNIGIGFRTFAAGIFFGVGSLALVGFNGLMIGMVAGYLTARGFGETFWQFVCGHGAFELNAIVLCGVTGLMLGGAVLAPGRRTRRDALVLAAREAVPILYGAAAMLFVAAVIEAFWSSRLYVPAPVKYGFAAFCWLAVARYFLRAGRPAQPAGTEAHAA